MLLKNILYGLFFSALVVVAGCGSKEKKNDSTRQKLDNPFPATGMCVADSTPVLSNISENRTSSYLHWADVVKLEPDSQADSSHPGTFFHHIVLDGGINGFVKTSDIVPGGKLAAITDSISIYSSNDSALKTGASFVPMDIVIAASEGTMWTEIRSGKNGKKGWIQSGHLAYNQTDIQAATAIAAALAEPDPQKRNDGLHAIVNNLQYDKSVFLAKIPAPSISQEKTDSANGTNEPESAGTNMAE
jgi:hypothetical protein